jgi:fructokinase|tara:strand:- start:3920 stop:4837 length:918 start_codon:yes stop_codon:yes gene_type:complete
MIRIGVDLGGTKIEALALDQEGRELERKRVPTPRGEYQGTIKTIVELVRFLEEKTGEQGTVGIGIPGTFSPKTRLVKNANSTWLIGKPFHLDMMQALSREVRFANDANCLAVSEAVDGAGQGAHVVFAVILGTGSGSGIAINAQVHSGQHGIAGEWGHNTLNFLEADEFPGPDCYCGQKGCVETFVSGTGFELEYEKQSGKQLKGPEIISLQQNGDPIAEDVLKRYESRLARGLAMVANLLDPDIFVLGGGISNIERLYQTLPDLIPKWTFGHEFSAPVVPAKHGDSSGVRGAAWLWNDTGSNPV